MSRTLDHYKRYDNLVKLITRIEADKYPAARLILHVIEQQYTANSGNATFDGSTYYAEADGANQYDSDNVIECSAGHTVSESWVVALNEFANVPSISGTINPREVVKDFKNILEDQLPLALILFDYMYRVVDSSRTASARVILNAPEIKAKAMTITARTGPDIVNNLNLMKLYKDNTRNCHFAGYMVTVADINGVNKRGAVYAGTAKNLMFNPDKLILTTLLEGAFQQAVKTGETSNEFFKVTSNGTVPDDKDIIFYRKLGDSTTLYTKDKASGVESSVQKGSPAFMKLTKGNNCFNSGFTGTAGTTTCENFVTNCLAGKDISGCKEFMISGNWNENLRDEKVNPDIALAVLRKFGFGTKTVAVNEIGRNLLMIEDHSEWISKLSKRYSDKLDKTDISSIANNNPLTGYLKKLIGIINSSPGILNPDYAGKANLTQNPSAFTNTQLGRFGLLPKQVVVASGVPSMSSVLSLQNAVMSNRNQIGMNWGVMPQGLIFQRGGGMSSGIAEVLENAQDNSTFPLKLSKIMEDSFESFIVSLKSHGKDLDRGDKDHIAQLINELKEKENKLFKAAIYTDKYVRLLGALGQTDSSKTVTLDHAKEFVDRRNSYFGKVGKKQDDLFSILKALAEAGQQETTQETKSVSDYPLF
jgi:hypothetical protein